MSAVSHQDSQNRVRLCLALGPWQIVMLAACLRSHIMSQADGSGVSNRLVLFGQQENALYRKTMENIAAAIGLWDDIRWDGGALKLRPPPDEWPFDFKRHSEMLKSKLGVSRVDELWLCYLFHAEHFFVLETFPRAQVFLYEDGMQTAEPTPLSTSANLLADWRILPGLLRRRRLSDHYRSVRLCAQRAAPRYARRVRCSYVFGASEFPPPFPFERTPRVTVDDDVLRRVVARAVESIPGEALTLPARRDNDKIVLFIAQPFSSQGLMDVEDEKCLYDTLVRQLIHAGWTVWWKDHPRDVTPVIDQLIGEYDGARFVRLSRGMHIPVEILLRAGAVDACVSASSSSLFYLRRLLGIPCYTCASRFVGRGDPFLERGLDFCIQKFQDVDEILKAE